jgi:hypothetical protein
VIVVGLTEMVAVGGGGGCELAGGGGGVVGLTETVLLGGVVGLTEVVLVCGVLFPLPPQACSVRATNAAAAASVACRTLK